MVVGCQIREASLRNMSAVVLENELLKITIMADKGADIYEFIYKPKDIDVLWKRDAGIKEPGRGIATATDSQAAWMEHYEGGWQEIFPSGGGPCIYKGVEMNFHGEVSTLPWQYKITTNTSEKITVVFSVQTFRSPFKLERMMSLKNNDPRLYIQEKVTNLAGEEMDYMWGHHPAFGEPFLDEGVIIDIPAQWIKSQSMEDYMTRLPAKTRFTWPYAKDRNNHELDLSIIPPKEQRSADLAFLGELKQGWYGITNPMLGVGFGMVWPKDFFKHVWFWQELRGSGGWPWYSSSYVMALEPFTSYDDAGLTYCVENGTALKLSPGETKEIHLIALCYESRTGVEQIDENGNISIKNKGINK